MILIIGARSSGKREYAASLGYLKSDMSDDVRSGCKVIYDIQDEVDKAPEKTDELFELLKKKDIVISNEVGSGVIPCTPHGRASREAAGRLLIALAGEAKSVIRMVCGIPTVIK